YIFTSGTTGMPKASVMTHYRWLRGMAGLGQMTMRLKQDDALYCPLPLYHNNALTVSWGAVLGAGCSLALGRKFSASRFWDEIRRYDATSFCYIGELCRYLLNRPATPEDREHLVRLIVGNGLRPEIWEQFQQRFGIEQIYEFYGASESNLAFVNAFGLSRTAGFCPMPFAIVEFDAEEEKARRGGDGFLRKVKRGEVGLLVTEVTDKAPFDGYTDKKASEAKLLRDVFKKGDVWFNTGDLVRDQGWRHIQFVDRVGDTFRWKGENVATTEVEGALNAFPGIEQAVVYGVEVPDCDGRAGMASLSCADGAFDGAALAQHLHNRLPAYAVPLFLRLRAEQETTATFKYRKVDLKRAGFDPGQTAEPLYLLLDPQRGYEPLTQELYARIGRRELKF
ncbi:MAG: long-chain-acyl-CoA synthetase, partial [Nevskia sp.]|nr:long-chain-acyl-CoA synthetase [Nevskia sp.]